MHAWEWQSLVTVFGLLIGAVYLSGPLISGFPSGFWSARFAREIAFSTIIAIYTYVANGGRRNSNGVFDFFHGVKWIEDLKATDFCIPAIPYIMISCLILILVNSLLISAFCKLESKKRNVIFLSAVTTAINICMLVHILELQISPKQCDGLQ